MSKKFKINEDVYIILLRYFGGDIINIGKKSIKELKKNTFKGEPIQEIDKKVILVLDQILKKKIKKPEDYASIRWIYPEWDKETQNKKVSEYFKEEIIEEEIIEDSIEPEPEQVEEEITNIEGVYRNILPQRKAFIEWVSAFYEKQKQEKSLLPSDKNELNMYQYFVKEYLSYETPFRGLLVYHGLGTGKTATAVITSEGLSKNMPIYTMLPASLEMEFIKEVKRWGDILFKVDKNRWVFYDIQEIKSDLTLRKELSTTYKIDETIISKIFFSTKTKIKNTLINQGATKIKIDTAMKMIQQMKGIYLPSDDLSETRDVIEFTEDIKDFLNKKNLQKLFIEEQINYMIQLKYNFIHYNPFPPVDEYNPDTIDPDKVKTGNQELVERLITTYETNKKNDYILSPFKENVIVIDEVHNFVRQIINGSSPALVFYNWIVESEDVKLIFLSGTPIINKPAEVAILYNMLRGVIHVFEFSLGSNADPEVIQEELRNTYYKKLSSIEQIHVSVKKGRLVLSFTKNKTNYESIMVDGKVQTVKYNDNTLNEFFQEIFDGLSLTTLKDDTITPTLQEITSHENFSDFKTGKPVIFDKEIQLLFNRKQKLFDIYENDTIIDLSQNENFVNYFINDAFEIPSQKQVLLRRMLMGLTSYYPIDRSSIVNMPQITEASVLPRYENYSTMKNITIVPCYMTSMQWNIYEQEYSKDKLKTLQKMRRKEMYDDNTFDFNIRSRQHCNIIYEDDSFRKNEDLDEKKEAYSLMKRQGNFSMNGSLQVVSPKFYEIMKKISKYIDSDGNPIGKILYYSDFRQDAGSEAFEQILIDNGYESFDNNSSSMESLLSSRSKKKRFTFITGNEDQDIRRINKEAFNQRDNIYGEYIQIMIISSAGAEGISLTGVRQAHIMEPFWNFIRIGQVFGRAIRMKSHIGDDPSNPLLPPDKRFVEQYLYCCFMPEGETYNDIFKSLKQLNWNEVADIEFSEDIQSKLVVSHKNVHKLIQKIFSVKKETKNRTSDQILIDIMEKKNIVSNRLTNIIKESSVDCIQNTTDNLQLNDKCLRFSSRILSEEAHFPGLSSSQLNQVDKKQFLSKFIQTLGNDTYVITAKQKETIIYVYYQLNKNIEGGSELDIRYIRENGQRVCDYIPEENRFYIYETMEHPYNKLITNKFSVINTIYLCENETIVQNISKYIFPSLDKIKNETKKGYLIKYNISDRLFYSPITTSNIIKLYDYNTYIANNYTISTKMKSIVIRNKKIYISQLN